MVGKIVLASSSPRRAAIMTKAKVKFEIIPSPYIEDHTTTVFSYEFIENLAYNKAKAVIPILKEPATIVGADTVVVLDGEILGKPNGYEGAFEMLKRLSGKTHSVVTSIVVMNSQTQEYKKNSTTSYVTFENLTDEQIRTYIDKFKPFDKAGSYGVQEWIGYVAIKGIEGSYFNVMGLPVQRLYTELKRFVAY